MKLSIAFASLLGVLFGVVQGAFDLDGNIENIRQREGMNHEPGLRIFEAETL